MSISFLKKSNFSVGKMSSFDNIGEFAIFTGFRNANVDKKETIYEDFILNSVESLNQKIGKNALVYDRCLSNCEGKN